MMIISHCFLCYFGNFGSIMRFVLRLVKEPLLEGRKIKKAFRYQTGLKQQLGNLKNLRYTTSFNKCMFFGFRECTGKRNQAKRWCEICCISYWRTWPLRKVGGLEYIAGLVLTHYIFWILKLCGEHAFWELWEPELQHLHFFRMKEKNTQQSLGQNMGRSYQKNEVNQR